MYDVWSNHGCCLCCVYAPFYSCHHVMVLYIQKTRKETEYRTILNIFFSKSFRLLDIFFSFAFVYLHPSGCKCKSPNYDVVLSNLREECFCSVAVKFDSETDLHQKQTSSFSCARFTIASEMPSSSF